MAHLLIKRIVTTETRVPVENYLPDSPDEAAEGERALSDGDKYQAVVEAISAGNMGSMNIVRLQEEVIVVHAPIPGSEGVMPGQG